MIFFLEIDGKLKKCFVHEPFSTQMHNWNAIRSMQVPGEEGFEFARDALKQVARQCVQEGKYEVREP